MFKVIGFFLVFVSWFGLSQEFDLKLAGALLFGAFLICSEGLFGHLMFMEREKVRSRYRSRR